MHVLCCTTTYNRDRCLKRLLRSYLEQDYTGRSTLLIFNSGRTTQIPLDLVLPPNKAIILVNKVLDAKTRQPYTSVGHKYRDSLLFTEDEGIPDIWTSSDVDDIFFPNHISEGVKGMERAYAQNKLGYKPKKSYFRSVKEVILNENVYEPSMFIDYAHIKKEQFGENSVKYHDKWLHPLLKEDKLLVDEVGQPTFCYDWGGLPVYKMSGQEDTLENFIGSQNSEKDYGTGMTNPMDKAPFLELVAKIKETAKEV